MKTKEMEISQESVSRKITPPRFLMSQKMKMVIVMAVTVIAAAVMIIAYAERKPVVGVPATLIAAFVMVIAYAEMKTKAMKIRSISNRETDVVVRGGEWPGPMTDSEKLRLYGECAAFSEDVYDRKDPSIKPSEIWTPIPETKIRQVSDEPSEVWAKFFPKDESKAFEFAFKVWERQLQDRLNVVIVFRGTDDREDWKSNFRWVKKRFRKDEDQYDLVQQLIPKLLKAIHRLNQGKEVNFITTGHSLGAGLAQQAAYVTNEIKEVYVFDPSPVTGYYDIKDNEEKGKGIKIDRIYERGEGLAYVRSLIRPFYQLSLEDPNITEVGFNFAKVGRKNWWLWFIRQHSMTELARSLQEAAR